MITKFSNRLYADLNKDLNAIVLEEDQLIKRLEKSIHVCLKYLRKLKDYCKLNDPGTPADEILFFKHIKPKFKSQLIFFQSLLNIEIRKPIGDGKVVSDYFTNEIKILYHFFESNLSFTSMSGRRQHTSMNIILYVEITMCISTRISVSLILTQPSVPPMTISWRRCWPAN